MRSMILAMAFSIAILLAMPISLSDNLTDHATEDIVSGTDSGSFSHDSRAASPESVILPRVAGEDFRRFVSEGTSESVSLGESTFNVTLLGVADEDTVVLKVGDEVKKIDLGENRKFSGLGIYVAKVFFLPKESQTSFAKLVFYR